MEAEIIYISSWQCPGGQIPDFKQVKAAGYAGVIVKPSQGIDYVNRYFKACADAIVEAGLMLGASPYAQPAVNEAGQEAGVCLEVIKGYDLDLGLWLDWDDPEPLSGMEAATWCEEWFNAVTGRATLEGIYIDQNQLNRVPGVPFSRKLWAADNLMSPPVTPFIQFVREDTVPGISGLVCIQRITNIRGLNPGLGGPVPYLGKVFNMNQLQQGDAGQQVKVLQKLLNEHGQTLAVDGIFGPLTAAATSAVAEQFGLPQTPVATSELWDTLIG